MSIQFLQHAILSNTTAPMNVKGDVSTNWKMFKEAWCYYVTATELNKKPKEVQAGALCSVIGNGRCESNE